EDSSPVSVTPVIENHIDDVPQPKPIEPIPEVPSPLNEYFTFKFYGHTCNIRLPKELKINLTDCQPISIAEGWKKLSKDDLNNTIRDCIETRIRYSLCDWAYLQFLEGLGKKCCTNKNEATLLTAFLFCQSGYQMRIGVDSGYLVMLYASKHQIYDKTYFNIDGTYFYPLTKASRSFSICNAIFKGETPMSLMINTYQNLGSAQSEVRTINSRRYSNMAIQTTVNTDLIEFYNSYPSSEIGGNMMTCWAMYADTPLSTETRNILYPALRQLINGKTPLQSVQMLLNWVQTGFVYEYDDKVWGYDRAFFAEETLYYPYCDCEDRSILFSRIVRDLLDLDVALIYYPGHLAAAVCFGDDEINGDTMIIDGRMFTVCDPTYIGAPVGLQMPGLDYNATKAIVLKR
ncbi:MAG: hypothetical protein K2N03_04045, partial [Muribaculaceae bacterium]|nr:hypothetical protein [Muribaculaceae bacterium]